jgi:SAM-dependent methyltransferase
MSLASEYKQQFGWRAWPRIFDALRPLHGQTVLDLGCGVGDLAAELVARGARVIGVDGNEELLDAARSRGLADAEFRSGDLRAPLDLGVLVDGLWASFVPAYFPELAAVLGLWRTYLRPGGWIALTEIDDLFGHEPLGERTRSLLGTYAQDAFAAGWYDFQMGRKLRGHLEQSGFAVSTELIVEDQEFSSDGPALPEVVEGWRRRLQRMKLLRDFCGPEFEQVRDDFLGCLAHADHRSAAKVYCCIATSRHGQRTGDATRDV